MDNGNQSSPDEKHSQIIKPTIAMLEWSIPKKERISFMRCIVFNISYLDLYTSDLMKSFNVNTCYAFSNSNPRCAYNGVDLYTKVVLFHTLIVHASHCPGDQTNY